MDRDEPAASPAPPESDSPQDSDSPPESTAQAWDGMLREAFGGEDDGPAEESVIAAIERVHATRGDVLLRDPPESHSPVLRVLPASDSQLASDARYHVIGEIARGGIGVVYKARDNDLGRDVAIKVLRPDHADRPGLVERFVEEAQVAGQLQHPGIVPVYGLGLQADGRPQFAMKLVKGSTLAAVLEERAGPSDARRRLLGIFEQICQAMAYAHAKGVIHRDLKPANVMIGAFGEVLVLDWGLAKVLGRPSTRTPRDPQASIIATVRSDDDGSQSQDGSVMGTPPYMPPEQALGQVDDLDERADVFALGAILTEILTGDPPYTGDGRETLIKAARAKLDDAHERLDSCGADPQMLDLVKRCLAELPRDRPRDAAAVARAVSTHLEQAEERAHRARVAEAKAAAIEAEQRALLARDRLQTKRQQAAQAEAKRQTEAEEARRKSEQRRSAAARKTRNLAMATAAVAIFGALGTGWFLHARGAEHAANQRGLEGSVARALREAARLEGEQRWSEAMEVANSAADIAAAGPSELRGQATATVVRIGAETERAARAAEQDLRDRALIDETEELHAAYGLNTESRLAAFERLDALLRENGVDPESTDPAAMAARILERSPPVAEALGNALALIGTGAVHGSARSQRALAIEDALDPDPWRRRLRAAWLSADRATQREMIHSEEFAGQSFAVRRRAANRVVSTAIGAPPEPGDFELAHTLLVAAERERPDGALLRAQTAALHWVRPDRSPASVLRHATTAAALDPDSAGRRATLAWYERASGDLDRATAIYESALERGGDMHSRSAAAIALHAAGDDRAAAALMQSFDGSDELDALRARASWCLLVEGDHAAALALIERVVARAPEDAWAAMTHVVCLGALSGPDTALEYSTAALERWPNYSEMLRVHAWLLSRTGDDHAALAFYRRSHRVDPHVTVVVAAIHLKLMELGKYEAALEFVEPLSDKYRFHNGTHRCLAVLYRHLGQTSHADYEEEWAIALGARHAVLADRLHAAARREDHATAEAICRELLQTDDPYYIEYAELTLATTLAETRRVTEALQVLRRSVERAGTKSRLTSYNQYERERVLSNYERIVSLKDRRDEILSGSATPARADEAVAFAQFCRAEHRWRRGAGYFRRAFELDPEFDDDGYTSYGALVVALKLLEEERDSGEARRSEVARAGLGYARTTLTALERRAAGTDATDARHARLFLRVWLGDGVFRTECEERLSDQLPAQDLQGWDAFWADVDDTFDRLFGEQP